MIYNNLYTDFENLFPDCTSQFQKLATAANADPSDGMHVMFSFVVIPFVLDLLHNDDHGRLVKAFDFFEEMAESDSTEISEVLEFTIIENLMSHGRALYDRAQSYMGHEMLEYCHHAEQYLQVADQN